MFQPHKQSVVIRSEMKKSSILGNYDSSKSMWNRSSLISVTSKKSSIGKFIDFSKNSICSIQKNNEFPHENERSSGLFNSNSVSPLHFQSIIINNAQSSTQDKDEGVKLGKRASLFQKLLQSTLDKQILIKKEFKKNVNHLIWENIARNISLLNHSI